MTPTPPTTFDALAASRPKPLLLPRSGSAFYLFAAARTADARGDTAARSYWLDQFIDHLEEPCSEQS